MRRDSSYPEKKGRADLERKEAFTAGLFEEKDGSVTRCERSNLL